MRPDLRTRLAAGVGAMLVSGLVGLTVAGPASADLTSSAAATTTTQDPSPNPTAAPTPTASASPTDTVTPTVAPTPSALPTATPTATSSPGGGAVGVVDAVLSWGINNESSNRAFAPRTFNFFSAGTVPNPGRGGTTLPRDQWRQSAGRVQVEKWDGHDWMQATWSGLSSDSQGNPLGSPSAGTFSNHRFTMTGGEGEVDVHTGTAHVTWDGAVTVLYYSGMSFFQISDPVLDVAEGRGRLTATVSGYASSIDDPSSWEPVEPEVVTLADLPDVDLADSRGFTTQPAYLGVRVDGVGQAPGGSSFGAFPASFVSFMDRLGTAAFWVSSGGVTDPFKIPLPLTVSYDAAVQAPESTPTPSETVPALHNPAITAPPRSPLASVVPDPAAPGAPRVAMAAGTPAADLTMPAVRNLEALPAAAPRQPPPTSDTRPAAPWWAGGLLLLVAAATLLSPTRRPDSPNSTP